MQEHSVHSLIPVTMLYLTSMGNFFIQAPSAYTVISTLRAPFFTAVTDVWPHANWAMCTNNLSDN